MIESMNQRFLIARKRYIEAQFSNLNDMQRQAVMTTEGPLLLLAGAGSGKTTVLIHRIANLIRFGCGSDTQHIPDFVTDEDVLFLEAALSYTDPALKERADFLCAVDLPNPWNILAITFTNKAASELKERLVRMLGDKGDEVWAMTFHAACCRILRKHIDRLGYTPHFTIYDEADSERLMKRIIKDMGLDEKTFTAKSVLNAISKEKDKMVAADDLLEWAQNSSHYRMIQIARAYKQYQTALQQNNAVDFDDIILLTVKLLQENEDIRFYYQRRFRYVLVDEYQDTNHLQYLLTTLLAGGQENLCVVGDDDQSIYKFRGATIENILDFEKQYVGARVIRLEQNYRSTQAILNAANAVISHNLARKGKTLWTANGTGESVVVYQAEDERAEAQYVAGQILSYSRKEGFGSCAILYRTNAQSNALEYALKRNGIAYRVIGGTRFFDRAEIKDMLAYLCVINNRSDDLRLSRIINNPPRGLGEKTLEPVVRLAQAAQIPLYSVLADPYSYGPLEKAAPKLEAFVQMIEDLASMLDNGMSLPDFYEELMVRTGYVAMLQKKDTEENLSRLENIRELKSSFITYVENEPDPTLAGFLEEIALYTDIEQYNASDDAVVMMTMHASKGLEFPHVFLVGCEDGLFPGMRAIGDREEMEEERRLCYVAITRAKQTLTITHARQRMLYGRTAGAIESRFLKELPVDQIIRKGNRPAPSYQSFDPGSAYSRKPTVQPSTYATSNSSLNSKPLPNYQRGDMVLHNAFGRGMVLSVINMGSDALLEVAFDQTGTRKLMAKAAASNMKKL